MKRAFGLLMILWLAGVPSSVSGDSWMRRGVPNGDRYGCALCHQNASAPQGASVFPLNGFGLDVKIFLRPSNYTKWSLTLATRDSDSDGYTNGEELQERTGSWRAEYIGEDRVFDPDNYNLEIGDRSQISNPGDAGPFGGFPRVNFQPITPDTVNVGDAIVKTFVGTSSAQGRPIVFEFVTATSVPPEGATVAGDQLRWTPVFEQGGTNRILIRMSDGTQDIVQSYVVTVLGGAIPPEPPEPPIAERFVPPVTDFNPIKMDFDQNRRVDFTDFIKISGAFGSRDFRYDFDRDGFVNFRDMLYFVYFYNQRVSTAITYRTPGLDQHVFEPVTAGDIVFRNSESGLFERAHSDNILIGKYEVTNAQYFLFWESVNRQAERTPLAVEGEIFGDYQAVNPTLPVVGVDYASAEAYCNWVSGRLPTWSEWVIAANGEEERLYAHGNEISPADANYFNSGDPFEPGPSPVGYYDGESDGFTTNDSFSKYAAYDMTGNVWEWVNRQRETFGISEAVIMGGSFDDDQFGSALFSQAFNWVDLDTQRNTIGFRCARDQ
jgi:hypothetical protein